MAGRVTLGGRKSAALVFDVAAVAIIHSGCRCKQTNSVPPPPHLPPTGPGQEREAHLEQPSVAGPPRLVEPFLPLAHTIGVMHQRRFRLWSLPFLMLALLAGAGSRAWAQDAAAQVPATQPVNAAEAGEFRPVIEKLADSRNISKAPETVAELLDLESRIRQVVEKVLPATVSLVITRDRNQFQGSGVVISPDGYVLTAAHVAERPGNRVMVIMPDGTRYRAVSLGLNRGMDDGLVKITDAAATNLPFAPLGGADDLPLGTWTIALGHPGGYQQDRPPVVRVGRILAKGPEFLRTDNTLVGGDSGGPLFDLDGRVIGIHSRIEQGIEHNVHVPSDRFLDDWDQLLSSEDWGGMAPEWMRRGPVADDGLLFDNGDVSGKGARVVRVYDNGPGAKAGIQVHDRIIAIDDKPVTNGQDVMLRRTALRPDEPVTYTVRRGDETLKIELTPINPERLRRPRAENDPKRPVMGIGPDQNYYGPGVRLSGMAPGGPAERAGLQAGDLLMSFNGQFLRNGGELGELMYEGEVGETISLDIRRGVQRLRVEIELRAFEEVYPDRVRRR